MPRTFTDEEKLARRQAQSERMKAIWVKRHAQKQGYQESPIVGVSPRSVRERAAMERDREREQENVLITETQPSLVPTGDPWMDLPFEEALTRLTKLEKEITHARHVMVARSAFLPRIWTCWTAANRKAESNLPGMSSAYGQCAKNIPDGKWVFKDDCVINKETGMVDPVVCCSNICYALYQTYRSRLKAKERQEE